MIYILLGLPGCGKGTVSSKLISDHHYLHLSTGNMFREIQKEDSPLATKVKEIISKGLLMTDDITNELVKKALAKHDLTKVNLIFDGYPRTINQAQFLDSIVQIDKVILLDVNEDLALKRIHGRLTCPTCQRVYNKFFKPSKVEGICDHDQTKLIQRKDDNETSAKKRFAVYHEQTAPLIKYYQKQNKLHIIDANDSSLDIASMIANLK